MTRWAFPLLLGVAYAVALSAPLVFVLPMAKNIGGFSYILLLVWIILLMIGFNEFGSRALWMLPGALFAILPVLFLVAVYFFYV